jgi:branched-chain amino acid transport system substrate-binding protein
MIKYLATASLLLAGMYLSTSPALAADPGITDTEIVIGDVEPLTGPPALLGVAASPLGAAAQERVRGRAVL